MFDNVLIVDADKVCVFVFVFVSVSVSFGLVDRWFAFLLIQVKEAIVKPNADAVAPDQRPAYDVPLFDVGPLSE